MYIGKYSNSEIKMSNNNCSYSYKVWKATNFWLNVRYFCCVIVFCVGIAMLQVIQTFYVLCYILLFLFLMETFCISQFALYSFLLSILIMSFEQFWFEYKETDEDVIDAIIASNQYDTQFDSQCNITTVNIDDLVRASSTSAILLISVGYISSLYFSKKHIKKIALGILISGLASTLDLMTDIIVIYVWIVNKQYYWCGFQIWILVSSQWISIYFMIIDNNKKNKYSLNKLTISSVMDLFIIFVGFGKLWFGMKKLMFSSFCTNLVSQKSISLNLVPNNSNNINSTKRSDHDCDYDYNDDTYFTKIKLWELLFESLPTLFLSCYILLLDRKYYRIPIVISISLSFCNLSLTLIKNIAHARKLTSKAEKASKIEISLANMISKDIVNSNSSSNEVETSSKTDINKNVKEIEIVSDENMDKIAIETARSRSQDCDVLNEIKFRFTEHDYIKEANIESDTENNNINSDQRSKCQYFVKLFCCCLINIDYDKKIWFDYFMLWLFSVSDSLIRSIPILMFVSFIQSVYVTDKDNIHDTDDIIVFLIFSCIYLVPYLFELIMLTNNVIIEQIQIDDENENWNEYLKLKQITINLIYAFYCVMSNGLYLLVLIKLPYLNFKISTNIDNSTIVIDDNKMNKIAKYFAKYQMIRILFSLLILIVLLICQLNSSDTNYYSWSYLTCILIFIVHCITFNYFIKHLQF